MLNSQSYAGASATDSIPNAKANNKTKFNTVTYGTKHKQLDDLLERVKQGLRLPFLPHIQVSKDRSRTSNYAAAGIVLHRMVEIDHFHLYQLLVEHGPRHEAMMILQLEQFGVRKIYVIYKLGGHLTKAQAMAFAQSALMYAAKKWKVATDNTRVQHVGESTIDISQCEVLPKDDPILHTVYEWVTLKIAKPEDLMQGLLVHASLGNCQISHVIIHQFGQNLRILHHGAAKWATSQKIQCVLHEALIQSMMLNAKTLLQNQLSNSFSVQSLVTNKILKAPIQKTTFQNFNSSFSADIVAQQYMDLVFDISHDEILGYFQQHLINYIVDFDLWGQAVAQLQDQLRVDLTLTFDQTFTKAVNQIKEQHPSLKHCCLGKNLSQNCMKSWAAIKSASLLPMSAYTIDQLLAFMRVAIIFYKWLMVPAQAASKSTNNQQNLVQAGASGTGKSIVPAVLERYFSFCQIYVHALFQNADVILSSGYYANEYCWSQILKPDHDAQLKNFTDSAATQKFQVKNQPSVQMSGGKPFVCNTNENVRQPFTNKAQQAQYAEVMKPYQRRFVVVDTIDTYHFFPLPLRDNDSESTLAAYAQSMLVMGMLLCQNSYKAGENISYVEYEGVQAQPPTEVIIQDMQELVKNSDEPLIYLLRESPTLAQQIYQMIGKLEASSDISITANSKKAQAILDSYKQQLQSLMFDDPCNSLYNVKLVDYQLVQYMYPIGRKLHRAAGYENMQKYLESLKTSNGVSTPAEIFSLIPRCEGETDGVSDFQRQQWLDYTISWYSMRNIVRNLSNAQQKLGQSDFDKLKASVMQSIQQANQVPVHSVVSNEGQVQIDADQRVQFLRTRAVSQEARDNQTFFERPRRNSIISEVIGNNDEERKDVSDQERVSTIEMQESICFDVIKRPALFDMVSQQGSAANRPLVGPYHCHETLRPRRRRDNKSDSKSDSMRRERD